MASELEKIIDPNNGSGTHYLSEDALEDDLAGTSAGNLVLMDQYLTVKCRCTGGTADTAANSWNGWITDDTRYIKVLTDPSESYRHNGTYQTGNVYRREISDANFCTEVRESYVRYEGIAFKMSAHDNDDACFKVTAPAAGEVHLSHCVCQGSNAADSDDIMGIFTYNNAAAVTMKVWNNVFYNFANAANTSGMALKFNGHSGDSNFLYHNTIVDNAIGTSRGKGAVTIKNDCWYNNGDDLSGTITGATNVAYDEHGADPGSGGVDLSGTAATAIFAVYGSDDFRILDKTSPLFNAGTNVYADASLAVTDDVEGHDRPSTGNPDIGFDEYIGSYVSGGAVTFPALSPAGIAYEATPPGSWLSGAGVSLAALAAAGTANRIQNFLAGGGVIFAAVEAAGNGYHTPQAGVYLTSAGITFPGLDIAAEASLIKLLMSGGAVTFPALGVDATYATAGGLPLGIVIMPRRRRRPKETSEKPNKRRRKREKLFTRPRGRRIKPHLGAGKGFRLD